MHTRRKYNPAVVAEQKSPDVNHDISRENEIAGILHKVQYGYTGLFFYLVKSPW